MTDNEYLKQRSSRRYRMFEICVVICVIALLLYLANEYHRRPVDVSESRVFEFQAAVFARAVANINALGVSSRERRVTIREVTFFLNEKGWPANTDATRSPSLRNQTARECQQLWNGIFTNAPNNAVAGEPYNKNTEYIISLNKNVICRFELLGKQEGSYFFDYHVNSGEVRSVNP